MKRWVVFSGLVAALMAHPVAAFQQPSSAVDDQTVTELPSIDVKANVQRNVIDDFVRAVTASPGHQGQVAQFNGEVCPGVSVIVGDEGADGADCVDKQVHRFGVLIGRKTGAAQVRRQRLQTLRHLRRGIFEHGQRGADEHRWHLIAWRQHHLRLRVRLGESAAPGFADLWAAGAY